MVLFIVCIGAAPGWLLYSDPPIRADVAAIMIGPGFDGRISRGRQLLVDMQADYLLIPGRCVLFDKATGGRLNALISMLQPGDPLCIDLDKPSFRVRTHLELELTKRMMERLGFRSVNLVSSPYHMRRIRIIADNVFGGSNIKFACVSASDEGLGSWDWWLRPEERWWVFHEYLKLAWFGIYSFFR